MWLLLALIVLLTPFVAKAATFTVTNVFDSGAGSFRQAIIDANATVPVTPNVIVFSISGGVVRTVNLASALPSITQDLVIDGTTMSGYAGSPMFELNGTSAGASVNGLNNVRGRLTVKALIINRFGGDGIRSICTSACNTGSSADVNELYVTGSYIGIDKLGVTASPNTGNGIYYQPFRPSKTTIGGNLSGQLNVISGNGKNGILIRRPDSQIDSPSFADVAIINSYIGVNVIGAAAVGNGLNGIATEDGSTAGHGLLLYIGSDLNGVFGSPETLSGDRNIIAGNGANGVISKIQQTLIDVKGNYIGTNLSGTIDLGNVLDGITVSGAGIATSVNLQIGGAVAAEGNLISGNNGYGIESASQGAVIEGNKIGTNAAGTAAIANSLDGVRIFGTNSFVGGSNAGEGNLISGNVNGIMLEAGADGTQIRGNKIGTNFAGTATLGNTQTGLVIKANSVGVGLANNSAATNTMGGNSLNGILVVGNANGVDIFDNYVGTNASDANLANGYSGIQVGQCGSNIRIGADATIPGASNVIAHNGLGGVIVTAGCVSIPAAYANVAIRRNSIYSNNSGGIDLLGISGVDNNDLGDGDSGPNGLQNYPVLIKVSPTQLYGTLNSKPNQTYAADFYQSPTCSTWGHGDGKTYLGSANLTTNAAGNVTFNLTGLSIAIGQVINATATDASGNTSEFSQCVTATNSPGNISFNAASSTGAENSGFATISVDRVGGASGPITVDYTTSNGTAIAGVDYTTTTNTLTFLDTETIKTIFVPLINNTKDEPTRTFNVTLSNPTGGAFLGSTTTHTFSITDDDPPPTVSIGDISVLEGNQGQTTFSFPVSLSAASGLSSSVSYSTANGTATATQDYAATTGTVNFAPGEVLKTATVMVNGDLVPELDETFLVNLNTPVNLTINDGQAVGTILDDDAPGKIAFAFAAYSVSEASGNAIITLTRTNGLAGSVAVSYQTSNGTATAGSDYSFTSGIAIFNDGQASTSFNIPITNDLSGEANETVFISISSPLGGATLGSPTSAVLTIFDDDGGLPPSVAIGGQIVENSLPLAGVSVALAGSQVATATTDATGSYNFTGLPSAGNFLVTPTLTGHNFEPVSLSFTNLAANITNANFIGSTGPASRNVHVISTSVSSGQDANTGVSLTSLGNENSVAFSLSYDPTLVYNPHVSLGSDSAAATLVVNSATPGRLGVIVALPPGQSFPAGPRDLVKIAFNTVSTSNFSTPLGFSNSPVTRMTTDANAGGLPTSYSDGLIGFSQGYEADVASRPAGDGFVAVDDFTQVGRFVAGLDVPDSPVSTNEFQRADSSPRGTKGDGVLAVDDFTQAGRYAAGLDQGQKAGGPTGPLGFAEAKELTSQFLINSPDAGRDIHIVNTSAAAGSQVLVSVEIDAAGDENGIGFSVDYDSTKLSNPLVAAGIGAQGTFLIPNTATAGKVGVIIAFSPGSTISAGTKQLVTIRFDIAGSAAAGSTPLIMSDGPVIRRVSNANAIPLAATFTDGAITVLAPTAAGVTATGRVTTKSGMGIGNALITLTGPNGESRTTVSNPFGYYEFADISAGESYVISVLSKAHTFAPSSRLITPNDALEVNFESIE
ncbi:MAG: Calx-beta domain-containing protein [Acidobacteriota bacterium]